MKPTTLLIIGGYGNTGLNIAQLLLQHTDVHIIIAGRSEEKALNAATQLKKNYAKRVKALQLDATNTDQLTKAFQQCDMAVIAAATIEQVESVIKTAIETQTDYMDTQLSFPEKIKTLKKYQKEYEERNMTVITDAGFHPGVPAVLVRYAHSRISQLRKANVSSYMGINWKEIKTSQNTIEEFATELKNYNPTVFRNGRREKIPLKELSSIRFDFGEPIREKGCVPMYLHEFEALPEMIPSLKETGFYVAGFDWFTDNLVTPLTMLTLQMNIKWISRLMSRFFYWSLGTFSSPPYITILQLEAEGTNNDEVATLSIRLSHKDAYLFTAIPIVACILQYLQKKHPPGFYYQSHFVEPEGFLHNMEKMGVAVSTSFPFS